MLYGDSGPLTRYGTGHVPAADDSAPSAPSCTAVLYTPAPTSDSVSIHSCWFQRFQLAAVSSTPPRPGKPKPPKRASTQQACHFRQSSQLFVSSSCQLLHPQPLLLLEEPVEGLRLATRFL